MIKVSRAGIRVLVVLAMVIVTLAVVTSASAHPHRVTKGNGGTVTLANGQNHPGFVFNSETGLHESCEGINEPADSGPAGYGLETAHHGPDQGTPGKADGCFAIAEHPASPEADRNPAID
jgi:hypothetical protein